MGLFAAGFSGGELELACAISQSTGHVVFPVNSLLRHVRQLTYDALKKGAKEPLARKTHILLAGMCFIIRAALHKIY